jgi:hypothetical protein
LDAAAHAKVVPTIFLSDIRSLNTEIMGVEKSPVLDERLLGVPPLVSIAPVRFTNDLKTGGVATVIDGRTTEKKKRDPFDHPTEHSQKSVSAEFNIQLSWRLSVGRVVETLNLRAVSGENIRETIVSCSQALLRFASRTVLP